MVNAAQLLTIDKSRLQKRLGRLSEPIMRKVDEAIRVSLDV
jgi:mRNA interferase MazF